MLRGTTDGDGRRAIDTQSESNERWSMSASMSAVNLVFGVSLLVVIASVVFVSVRRH
jgi:hypothetical protein